MRVPNCLTILVSATAVIFAARVFAEIPKHTRVIWHEHPATKASISFTTSMKGSSVTVFLDTLDHGHDADKYAFRLRPQWQGKFTSSSEWGHHARFSDLSPDTMYFFFIQSDGDKSPVHAFKTAPAGDHSPFRLLFAGDSRSDIADRRLMNQRMGQLLRSYPDILALVHGGDYVSNGNSYSQWSSWLDDHALTSDGTRLLPVIPAQGNHERDSEIFQEIFDWPAGGRVYYTSSLGPLRVINLNTERSLSGDQKNWLGNTLVSLRNERWIVANYHRPAWPAVKDPGEAKTHWVPLFEKYRLDLVFESDGHALKRTVPIKNGRRDDTDGVIYVGEGGAGVKQRTPTHDDEWYFRPPGYAVSAHHVQMLEVSYDALSYGVILKDGSVYDRLTIKPRSHFPEDENPDPSPDPDPKPDPHPPGTFRVLNQDHETCLRYHGGSADQILYHSACTDSSEELFRALPSQSSDQVYLLQHTESGLCAEFSSSWLFFGMYKVIMKTCSPAEQRQWVRFPEAHNQLWKIVSVSEENCLHFSGSFRTDHDEFQAYHRNCSGGNEREVYRIMPQD